MVDVSDQAVVAILTRAPSAGGKSRLFAALGRAFDPALAAALLLDTLEAVAPAAASCVVCYTPETAEAELRAIVPDGVQLLAQGDGDLGARMGAAFDALLGAGARSVVLIGSDLPLIEAAAIDEAHRGLTDRPHAVVLGPAADGGYYLIGATRTPAPLFDSMRWGSATVLVETMARADAAGIEVILTSGSADVDTADDLRRVGDAPAGRALRTRAWVARSV